MPQVIQILPVYALKLICRLEKKIDHWTIFIISIGDRVTNGENQKSGTGKMLFINKKGINEESNKEPYMKTSNEACTVAVSKLLLALEK